MPSLSNYFEFYLLRLYSLFYSMIFNSLSILSAFFYNLSSQSIILKFLFLIKAFLKQGGYISSYKINP